LAFSLDYSSPMKKEPMYSYEKSVDFIWLHGVCPKRQNSSLH
jgi:hypothetical protein